jgi:hypothetical protein
MYGARRPRAVKSKEAACDVPCSEAEGRRAARGCARGAAHRARRPRAVESRRLRATRPAPGDWAQPPRPMNQGRRSTSCARGAAHRASGARRPKVVESRRLRAMQPAPGDWAQPPRAEAQGRRGTRLRERRCSQSERCEAAEGRREQEAASDAPRSRRLGATVPAQRLRAVE